MLLRWTTLLVWALVAGSAVAWGLKLFVQPAAVPSGTPVVDMGAPLQADLTRLLGADPPPPAAEAEAAPPPASSRFALLGVVAPRSPFPNAGRREGVALIAIDGQPPKAYRVGARVEGDTYLLAVNQRGAELGPKGSQSQFALALPPPAPAATGTLPGVGAGVPGVPGAAMPRAPMPVPPFAVPAARPPGAAPYTPYREPANEGQEQPVPQPAQPRNPNPTLM
jgi:general secretion pathway protein C